MPLGALNELFGASGEHYWNLAHGIDDRTVVPDRDAKSISNETTFAEDISEMEVLRAWLVDLVEQVARCLRRHDIKGRTIELKVRYADFKAISRSLTLAVPTNITQELLEAGIELLTKRLPPNHLSVRLLGFGVKYCAWTHRAKSSKAGGKKAPHLANSSCRTCWALTLRERAGTCGNVRRA